MLTVPDLLGRDCDGGTLPVPETPVFRSQRNGPDSGTPDATLSDLALALVDGPRQDAYAPPEQNMARIGSAWAAMLGLSEPIPGWRVALMLAGMKVIRAAYKPGDDSLVDAVGYLEIAKRIR